MKLTKKQIDKINEGLDKLEAIIRKQKESDQTNLDLFICTMAKIRFKQLLKNKTI